MLREWQFYSLLYSFRVKGENIGYMKSIGAKMQESGEGKMGKSLGLDKKENGERHASFTLVGTRLLIINIYHT